MEGGGTRWGGFPFFYSAHFLRAYAQVNEPYQTTLFLHHHLVNSPTPSPSPLPYRPGTPDQLAGHRCSQLGCPALTKTWSCLFLSAHVLRMIHIKNTGRTSVEGLRNQPGSRVKQLLKLENNVSVGENKSRPDPTPPLFPFFFLSLCFWGHATQVPNLGMLRLRFSPDLNMAK